MRSEEEINKELIRLRREVMEEFELTRIIEAPFERLEMLNEVTAKNSKVIALSWVLENRETLCLLGEDKE